MLSIFCIMSLAYQLQHCQHCVAYSRSSVKKPSPKTNRPEIRFNIITIANCQKPKNPNLISDSPIGISRSTGSNQLEPQRASVGWLEFEFEFEPKPKLELAPNPIAASTFGRQTRLQRSQSHVCRNSPDFDSVDVG